MSRLTHFYRQSVVVIAYIAAIAVLISSLTFAFAALRPIDVLRDWRLQTTGTLYHPGDALVVRSTVTKLMNVTGSSNRYIVCMTGNVEERFNTPQAVANRPTGIHTSELTIFLPLQISNLPRVCHVNIVVNYMIYGFRGFTEMVDSNSFTITAPTTPLTSSSPVKLLQVTSDQPPTDNTLNDTTGNDPTTGTNNGSDTAPIQVLGVPLCLPLTGLCIEQ